MTAAADTTTSVPTSTTTDTTRDTRDLRDDEGLPAVSPGRRTGVPTMSHPAAASGASQPNLATLAQLRGGGRNPLLSPTSRRARPTRPCTVRQSH